MSASLHSVRDHCLQMQVAFIDLHNRLIDRLREFLPGASLATRDPDWTPTLPARRDGASGLADILAPVP